MTSVGGHMSHRGRMLSVDRSHVPVSRGMLTGGLLAVLGVWGGLVPFVGPEFGYAYTPDTAWTWTWGRFWLEVLPAIAVILGGVGIAGATNRVGGQIAGWLAAVGGAWFVVGPTVSRLWAGDTMPAGEPVGESTLSRTVQEIGFFYGLGVVIVFLAALAIGRFGRAAVREPGPDTEDRQPGVEKGTSRE